MKKFLISVTLACAFIAAQAQDIKLLEPSTQGGVSVMEALWNRHSERAFSNQMLSDQMLSDLLFATAGINRPEKGLRTAPTARNNQELDLYALTADGVYIYDPSEHSLKLVVKEDCRSGVCGPQEFAKTAPVVLVIVIDFERNGKREGHAQMMAYTDAGLMAENALLFCASQGLACVPRGFMGPELPGMLRLNENQVVALNIPIGYAANTTGE